MQIKIVGNLNQLCEIITSALSNHIILQNMLHFACIVQYCTHSNYVGNPLWAVARLFTENIKSSTLCLL